MEEYLCNWKLEKVYLSSPRKKMKKQDKLDIIKIKALFNRLRRKTEKYVDWKKIYATHLTDKGLPAGIYKESLQFNKRKENHQIKNEPKSIQKSQKEKYSNI